MSTSLCNASEIKEGYARGFDLLGDGKDTVFVIHVEGAFYAYVNACPHYRQADRVPLAWGKDKYLNADATHIACAGHGALFEAQTGLCVSGPCKGTSLVRVPIEISSEGRLNLPTTRLTGENNDPTR